MPRREMEFEPGSYYHVFNRGVNKERIFFEQENYHFFIRRMREYLVCQEVEMIAYCLMPNHFHMIVCPLKENFSARMGLFGMSYAKAINSRYKRVGPLFQSRFQAKWVGKNEYLLHLSRYIHINPVLGKLVGKAEDWEFSSYRDYLGLRREDMLKPGIVLEQFSMFMGDIVNQQKAYREFVEGFLGDDIHQIQHLL
jgi:REP element-mobilizing transposase RayT